MKAALAELRPEDIKQIAIKQGNILIYCDLHLVGVTGVMSGSTMAFNRACERFGFYFSVVVVSFLSRFRRSSMVSSKMRIVRSLSAMMSL